MHSDISHELTQIKAASPLYTAKRLLGGLTNTHEYMLNVTLLIIFSLLLARPALAHCPLCTVGAGAAAGLAVYLGVSPLTIGLFVGAFALALGLWIGRMIKRQYVPKQTAMLGALSFVTTTFPLIPLIPGYTSLSIFWTGGYGSLLNRTYLIPVFMLGSVIGAAILMAAPLISRAITRARGGRTVPYQGIILTFGILLALGLIFELAIL